MTTPNTMGRLIDDLRERFASAKEDAAESRGIAMNSYGAGYDAGVVETLSQILQDITGDDPRG